MELLQRVFHPNICALLAISFNGPRRCLVLEFCAGGALDARIKELNCCQRVQAATAIGRGLQYLHSLNPKMIHRDVKTANVLVSKACISPDQDMTQIIKVSDFGTVSMVVVVLVVIDNAAVVSLMYYNGGQVREHKHHRSIVVKDMSTATGNEKTHNTASTIIGTMPYMPCEYYFTVVSTIEFRPYCPTIVAP